MTELKTAPKPAPAPGPASPRSFWQTLKDAIAGTEELFTEGPIGRPILLLAVPMILEMGMEMGFSLVDMLFVSRLGPQATAAVGTTEAVMGLVTMIAGGLSMATTALVARRIGERDVAGAVSSAAQSLLLALAISILLCVGGLLGATKLLALMGADAPTIALGRNYAMITFGTSLLMMLLFLQNAIFRGAGDAVIAMRTLIFANGINILLDPCLIFGLGPFPRMGVTGAAISTTIGRGLGVLFQLYILLRGSGRIHIKLTDLRFDLGKLGQVMKISLGGLANQAIANMSTVALIRIAAVFGAAIVADTAIISRVFWLALVPTFGMANAAATLVGQNLGAKNPERAERSVWTIFRYNGALVTLIAIAFIAFASPIMGLFVADAAARAQAAQFFRIASCGYVFFASGLVCAGAFTGAGDTIRPTLINLFNYWFWMLPLAAFLSIRTSLGPPGLYYGWFIAEATGALITSLWFRRGKWKTGTA
jgi:putative MATE family efflux protein